jgi:hypothetical protein
MNWFAKSPKKNSPVPAAASDLRIDAEGQALSKIKNMCAVATASAESVAQCLHDDLCRGERQRFESAKRMSLELAKGISDVLYRDTALQQIVELCMKANDIETARILVRGIQTGMIREKLVGEYPVVFY